MTKYLFFIILLGGASVNGLSDTKPLSCNDNPFDDPYWSPLGWGTGDNSFLQKLTDKTNDKFENNYEFQRSCTNDANRCELQE